WHGASWNYILWGFYNGVLLALHRLYDQALNGRTWADRVRGNPVFRLGAVGATFLLVASGLILVRSESWAGCWLVERSLFGFRRATRATHWLPAWVPLLVGMVVLGHLFSGFSGYRCRLLEWPPLLRAGAYVAAVVLVVAFGPGATKAFIYFQF